MRSEQLSKDDQYFQRLGDSARSQLPDEVLAGLHDIPGQVNAIQPVLLDRVSWILNAILGAWITFSVLLFKDTWMPLLDRIGLISLDELAAMSDYSIYGLLIFGVFVVLSLGLWTVTSMSRPKVLR